MTRRAKLKRVTHRKVWSAVVAYGRASRADEMSGAGYPEDRAAIEQELDAAVARLLDITKRLVAERDELLAQLHDGCSLGRRALLDTYKEMGS
jgi:hypothetical protein